MNPKRTKIFIGHANPEDNEFTEWIQSKLSNEGYNVESDLTLLIGGEKDFWNNIQEFIKNDICKYILVLSKNTFNKDGIVDEWEYAKSIEKEFNLKDFIIPLRLDDVSFNTRIGLNKRNIIPFNVWSIGLKRLFSKLKLDRVPKTRINGLGLSLLYWYKNRYSIDHGILNKKEKFYSNWLEIPTLPETLYFFRYENDTQAKAILNEESKYPVIRHDNYLITFKENLKEFHDDFGLDVKPNKTIKINTQDIFHKYDSPEFPKYIDSRRFLVRLLKKAFSMVFRNKQLLPYELSGNLECFYYPLGLIENDKIFFPYDGKIKWRQLLGKVRESYWHYALSFHPLLFPNLCFSMRAHIVFSDDGKVIWDSKKRLHSARRSKGKRMFNKEWRDLMLAFLYSLASEDKFIHISLSEQKELIFPPVPITFYSSYGYNDPHDHARIIPIDDYEEEDDLIDEYTGSESKTDE